MLPDLTPERRWSCPNCEQTALTHEAVPQPRFHACKGLRGLTAPMIADGVRCKVEAVEREDYTNGDDVQTDGEGRAVMAVVTTRETGQDRVVLASCASAGVEN